MSDAVSQIGGGQGATYAYEAMQLMEDVQRGSKVTFVSRNGDGVVQHLGSIGFRDLSEANCRCYVSE